MTENRLIVLFALSCIAITIILSYVNAVDEVNCKCEQLQAAVRIIPKESPVYTNWTEVDTIIVYGDNLSSCKKSKVKGSVLTNGKNGPADVEHNYTFEIVYKPMVTAHLSHDKLQNNSPKLNDSDETLHVLDMHVDYLTNEDEITLFMWGKKQSYRFKRLTQCKVYHLATAFSE